MNMNQTKALILAIDTMYPNSLASNKSDVLNMYHNYLKDYDVELVMKNFDNHIKKSSYAPKIADLIGGNKPKEVKQAIPNVAETRQCLLEQQLALPDKPTDQEYIARLREQAMKEIARGAAMNAARNPRKEWHPDDEQ